jgi:hypothetical protein
MTLTGTIAIEFAEANDLLLNKYTDPTEEAREGLTPEEARAVAREDARLIWLDAELLVVDPITDATETADSCVIRPLAGGNSIEIDDPRVIRALYNWPDAISYGDGSYTV